MRRAPWILLALVGVAVGFYVARQNGSDGAERVAEPPPAPAPPATSPPPTPLSKPKPKPRPAFTSATLPQQVRTRLRHRGWWHSGCPVALSGLRLLTVSYRGFDGKLHNGSLVVNAA